MRIAQLASAAAVYFVTVQAIYWPVIMKPGTELQFWQMRWASDIGFWLGAPVVAAISVSPLSGNLQHVVAHGLALLWAGAIYWFVGYLIRRFKRARATSAT